MPPAAGELFKCVFRYRVRSQECQNVLVFRGMTGTEDANALGGSLQTNWPLIFSATWPGTVTFIGWRITQQTPLLLDLRDVPYTTIPATGTNGSDSANNTLAPILTLRTGTAGKTHRGRMYLPGIRPDYFPNDTLTAAALTNLNNFATNMLAKYGPSGTDPLFKWGIYSRVLGGGTTWSAAGWQQITQIDVQTVVGNQRRRRIGVGI